MALYPTQETEILYLWAKNETSFISLLFFSPLKAVEKVQEVFSTAPFGNLAEIWNFIDREVDTLKFLVISDWLTWVFRFIFYYIQN